MAENQSCGLIVRRCYLNYFKIQIIIIRNIGYIIFYLFQSIRIYMYQGKLLRIFEFWIKYRNVNHNCHIVLYSTQNLVLGYASREIVSLGECALDEMLKVETKTVFFSIQWKPRFELSYRCKRDACMPWNSVRKGKTFPYESLHSLWGS